jgi:hypothetical protein
MNKRTNRVAWWRMERTLYPDNFDAWFDKKGPLSRYEDEAVRQRLWDAFLHIKQLAQQGREEDVQELVRYLCPWDPNSEVGYSGPAWLEAVTQQVLCHLGSEDPRSKTCWSRSLPPTPPSGESLAKRSRVSGFPRINASSTTCA